MCVCVCMCVQACLCMCVRVSGWMCALLSVVCVFLCIQLFINVHTYKEGDKVFFAFRLGLFLQLFDIFFLLEYRVNKIICRSIAFTLTLPIIHYPNMALVNIASQKQNCRQKADVSPLTVLCKTRKSWRNLQKNCVIYIYIYIYIYGRMKVNLTVCKCTNMKKQGIQRLILFIVELFANVTFFFFFLH